MWKLVGSMKLTSTVVYNKLVVNSLEVPHVSMFMMLAIAPFERVKVDLWMGGAPRTSPKPSWVITTSPSPPTVPGFGTLLDPPGPALHSQKLTWTLRMGP